ncbi:MAG: hypothetical protein R2729_11175 [Bryobacteraceae bacterium]
MKTLAVAIAVVAAPIASAQLTRPDTANFVVLGEGLAAGMGDFGLHEVWQKGSFPAVMARAFNTNFPIPLIQAPGIGNAPGWPQLPARVPGRWQTTVREASPSLFVFHLAVPGLRLEDALARRPREPLVQTNDPLQTSVNLLLGFPALVFGNDKPRWSQADYAVAMRPTLALVALGYTEACQAAAAGDTALLPSTGAFRSSYDRLLDQLRATYADLVVVNIPDPFDTAYFAAQADGSFKAAPAGAVVAGDAAARVRAGVAALNREIASSAQAHNAALVDAQALFARWRAGGLTAGTRRLTADYLGGIYNFSGFYPGHTGQAAIANAALAAINQTYSSNFPLADLGAIAAGDPAVKYRLTPSSERAR